MLNINMEDVVGVINACKPQLIVLAVVLVLAAAVIIAMAVNRKVKKADRFFIRWNAVLAFVLAVAVITNWVCLGPMANLISLTMGSATVSDETTAEAMKVAEQIAGEGFVLLENEDDLLPLDGTDKVNLFGWPSVKPVYGGAGPGGINDLYEKVSLEQGLEDAGFTLNSELHDFYTAYTSDRPEMSIEKQSWTLPEPPADSYSSELMENAKAFSNVAVIVFSRAAGEGHNDLPMDVSQVAFDDNSDDYVDFEPGEHYLQLSQTEEDLVKLVCDNFDQVIVLYNGANPLELGFVEEYDSIKAAIWCPGPGNVGFEALGQILSGELNPSGHTSDTFLYDMTKAPWWNNADKTDYSNLTDMAVMGMNSGKPQMYAPSFVNYVDGIYEGYKFYETAYTEAQENGFDFDYDSVVQYPFGFGLSYTTFDRTLDSMTESNGAITVTVTVTNTGDVAGKDVVGVYYNPPYTNGGIEKASVNLIDFAKTDLLDPGESQVLTMQFDAEDMASYDYLNAKAYVLEAGDYEISIRSDAHTVLDTAVYTVPETIVYDADNPRSSDRIAATNLFDEVAGDVVYLSRKNGFANYAEATAAPATTEMSAENVAAYHLNANFDYNTYIDPADEMPTTGAKNGLKLVDLRGADYNDARWDSLLDQLSVQDMLNMTSLCGYQTPAVESVGKVQTNDADGPAAINNNFTGAGSIGFPIPTVTACTWNQDLAHAYGEMMGKMARELDVAGWYAPGINLHRNAFGGRNYEYYSEDAVLTGKMAGNAVAGAETQGVYSYIKHFALYDGNYKMVSIWSNEQAMREIYLKPFEICVKDYGADAVMDSWNFLGVKWTGENSNLLNTVLRDEWGFRGMVESDYFRDNGHGFMNADAGLANGMDAMLSTYGAGPNLPHDHNDPSASTVKYLRQACKNIMYTVVNSWVYEDGAAASDTNGWVGILVGADVAAGVVLVGLEVLLVRNWRKRQAKETARK